MVKASLTTFYGAETVHYGTEAQEFKGMEMSDHIALTQTVNPGGCPL